VGGDSDGPLVFARRWDRLGSRLIPIVNAMAVAEALGLEFRFVWPPMALTESSDAGMFFSRDFLATHEMSEASVGSRAILTDHELVTMDIDDVRTRLASTGSSPWVEIQDPFRITRFASESADIARARFIRCFHSIEWESSVQDLVDRVSALPEHVGRAGVHARAGDVVIGEWRQTQWYGKYTPLPYVTGVIEQLGRSGDGSVLVLSDNTRLLGWLRESFPAVVRAVDLIPGYDNLPDMLQAFTDILLLARCRTLVGSPQSGFSRLAAHLGCDQVTPAERFVPPGQERATLQNGISHIQQSLASTPFLAPLVSRDIVWLFDVYGDAMGGSERIERADEAVVLDGGFMSAHTRVALATALVGDWVRARRAADEALAMAETEDRHDDPLVEALAVKVAVDCLASVLERSAGMPSRTLGHRSRARAASRRRHLKSSLADMHRAMERVEESRPEDLDVTEVLRNLRCLVSTVDWLSHASDTLLAGIDRALERWTCGAVDIARFRQPNHNASEGGVKFEAILRHLELVGICLSQAVGSALLEVGDAPAAAGRGFVDSLAASRTGVWWIEGWVVQTDPKSASYVAGYALDTDPTCAGGAAASIDRPDVDVIFSNPPSTASGFRIPLPTERGAGALRDAAGSVVGLSSTGGQFELGFA